MVFVCPIKRINSSSKTEGPHALKEDEVDIYETKCLLSQERANLRGVFHRGHSFIQAEGCVRGPGEWLCKKKKRHTMPFWLSYMFGFSLLHFPLFLPS